jgi:glycerol dehydrogenase
MIGSRPTAAAVAIAELGAKLLFKEGVKALEAVSRQEVSEAVENIVETNTLLSGIGFESGGLAAAHGIAQAMPMIPFIHKNYLHGEMVAMGLLAHLCLEGEMNDAQRIAVFFAKVGLPVHLGQLSFSPDQHNSELDSIVHEALKIIFMHYEPFEVTAYKLKQALLQAHQLGMEVSLKMGDEAHRRLHGS